FAATGLLFMTLIVELTVPDGWPIHITWAAMALGIMAWGPEPYPATTSTATFLTCPQRGGTKPVLKELCMKRAGFESQLGYRAGIAVIRSAMSSMQALGGAGGAWLDLAIRFWLAKGFLIAATLSMAMHAPLTMAFARPVSPTVDWLIASPLGATIATVCPILLLVGCCSRAASLPLLFQALALQGPQGPSPLHLFWGVLLGWIIVHGPGPLSIDAVLARGLVSTAIPGSSGLGQALAK